MVLFGANDLAPYVLALRFFSADVLHVLINVKIKIRNIK